MRFEPMIATLLLEFFCSDAEHGAIKGDLAEQYQAGRSNFWYSRQVLSLVCLALYNKIVRRPLVSANGYRIGENLILTVFLFGWGVSLLSTEFITAISGIVTASVFAFPHFNHERNRAFYYVVGSFLLIEMSLIAGVEVLIVMLPLGVLEAGVLACWHKFSTIEFQALGLTGKK